MPFDVSAATCCVGQRGATLKLFITQQTFFSPRIVRLTPWLTSAFWQGANVWLWPLADSWNVRFPAIQFRRRCETENCSNADFGNVGC